ncbi:MAG: hypothetical protein ACR2HH_05640 [Chthoniobacterales bacterium]
MPLLAGPLVGPGRFGSAFGDTGNLFPLFSSQPMRYQQVFDAGEFERLNPSGGGVITAIAFRGHGPGIPFTGTVAQLQVNLSTTTHPPDGLSSIFSDNIGSDDTQVFSGPFQAQVTYNGDPANFEVLITFSTPFRYDPAKGNLLLDVRNLQGGTEAPPDDQEVDGTSTAGDSVSRVYNFGSATATTAGTSGGVDEKDSYGLIAKINAVFIQVTSLHHGPDGHFIINGQTPPSTAISIQASSDLVQPFATIGSTTSDASGAFAYEDAAPASLTRRFYRATYP